jgi:hypothetical protein
MLKPFTKYSTDETSIGFTTRTPVTITSRTRTVRERGSSCRTGEHRAPSAFEIVILVDIWSLPEG